MGGNDRRGTWVLNAIRLGFALDFLSMSPRFFIHCPVSKNGTRRSRLEAAIQHLSLIQKAGHWAEWHLLSLPAEHFWGTSIVQADWLSRAAVNNAEWRQHPELFRTLPRRFGSPTLHLVRHPAKQPAARFATLGVEEVNALHFPYLGAALRLSSVSPHPRGNWESAGGESGEPTLVSSGGPEGHSLPHLVNLSVSRSWRILPDKPR